MAESSLEALTVLRINELEINKGRVIKFQNLLNLQVNILKKKKNWVKIAVKKKKNVSYEIESKLALILMLKGAESYL